MEKEHWINDLLDSTDGLQMAMPDASLFSKIKTRIQKQNYVSTRTIWIAAASIAILIAANVVLFQKCNHPSSAVETLTDAFESDNQLY